MQFSIIVTKYNQKQRHICRNVFIYWESLKAFRLQVKFVFKKYAMTASSFVNSTRMLKYLVYLKLILHCNFLIENFFIFHKVMNF